MSDTTDLDLSVLARVTPPEQDEKPQTSGGAVPGRPADEEPPPRRRRRIPNRDARVKAPPDPPSEPKSRTFVPDNDLLLPDYHPGMFVKPITDAYMTIGGMVLPFSNPIGTVIMQNAEPCAKSIDNAAKIDKRFRAYLLKAMGTGVLLPILIAHMPIIMVIVVVLFPGKAPAEVQLPQQGPDEVINPMSNGMRRPR